MNRPVETLNLNTTPAAPATPKTARRLALGAIAGPVLFTLAWLVLGFLSPGYTLWGTLIAPYSPIHQPISGLGMGPTAPFMNTAFVLSGLLLMAGVIGITQTTQANRRPAARWTVTALLALAPLGMVIDGIFNLQADPPAHARLPNGRRERDTELPGRRTLFPPHPALAAARCAGFAGGGAVHRPVVRRQDPWRARAIGAILVA